MSLPYNNNVPQASQTIASTQAPILQNFQSIDTVFDDPTNGNFTMFAVQNVGTPTTTPTDPVGIYHTKNGTNFFNSHPIPFFMNSVGDYPILPDLKTSGTNFGFQIGNIIFNWGALLVSGSSTSVTLAIPYTNVNTVAVTITPSSTSALTSGAPFVYSATTTTITFKPGSGLTTPIACSYFSIGT